MYLASNWIKLAVTCLLVAWLPAAAAAQPLIYVAGTSRPAPSLATVGHLTVINGATGQVVKTLELGPVANESNPRVVAAPDGSRAYVTAGGDLVIVDAANYSTQRLTLSGILGDLALSADGSRLYVASTSASCSCSTPGPTQPSVLVIDTGTLQQSGSPIPLPTVPRQLALTPAGTRLYVLGADTVYLADTATRAIGGTFSTRPSAVGLVVHPDGSRLYVSNSTGTIASPDGNSITAYDTTTLLEVDTTVFPDFRFYRWGYYQEAGVIGSMAIVPAGDRLYVPLINAGPREPSMPTGPFVRHEVVHVVDSQTLDVVASVTPPQNRGTATTGIAATASPGGTTVFIGATGGLSAIEVASNNIAEAGPGVADGDSLSAAPAPPCWFEFSPQQSSVRAPGGNLTLDVPAPDGCAWSVTGSGEPLVVSAKSGTGPSTITLQIGSSVVPRAWTVSVAGQDVRVDQLIPRTSIETPRDGAELTLPIDLAGWTIEQDAKVPQPPDSGIAQVHFYDYPASGPPIFLGGMGPFFGSGVFTVRPDVAAIYGERYRYSGFSRRIGRLSAGAHTLVVYSQSRTDGQFAGTAVNVTVRREPQIVIDAPTNGAAVTQPFRFYGWAADMTVPTGIGVDMVRVSARRADGTTIPVGNATLGKSRVDLSLTFGEERLTSGFELNVSGLPAGTYTLVAEARYTATGLFEKSASVQVTVTGSAPFGVVDTPIAGASVAGTVLVTGWALSEAGVSRVKIYRDPVGAERARIWIGDAAFVEGARPDVAAAFPGYPQNTRAGWGLAVLTNMLPNGGNGSITFHAYAYNSDNDVETLLGSRSVTGTNGTSVLPFGTLDTPGQGGTVSGTTTVFGWALTPGSNIIPTDGSTIQVVIDGVVVGQPTFNQCRGTNGTNFPPPGTCNDDIARAFGSAYRNIAEGSGAIGSFDLDTTTLTNGIHTIEWRVTDSAGNVQGIGSRYFYVQNGG